MQNFSDHLTATWMRAEWNIHWIWVTRENSFMKWAHVACFTNDFLAAIQSRWEFRLIVIQLLAIRSQQDFAQATIAQLLCLVQNFVALTVLESRWDWKEIYTKFELRWTNCWWSVTAVECITVTSYWARWRLKSPASRLLAQPFIQAQIKENTKAPRHWPCKGNPLMTGEFPAQRASNVEMFPFDDVIMECVPTEHMT